MQREPVKGDGDGLLRIASANVNGIRASVRRGLDGWLASRRPDVVGLQEMRCPVEALPHDAWPGCHLSCHPGGIAGRNGVALLTREPPVAVRMGFGSRTFDDEGRYLEVDLDLPGLLLSVGSLYLPKGGRPAEPAEQRAHRRKLAFLRSFGPYLGRARRRALQEGREFCVLGDFNIAHGPQDLANPRGNTRNPGYLPEERAWFDSVVSPRTLVDVVRAHRPDEQGPYSWWTWRGQGWNADAGWRIDYHLVTPGLARRVVAAGTDREASYEARMSDHSPVVVDYRH